MNIMEGTLALIAPHVCLGCGTEGSLLCKGCMYSSLTPLPSRCYRCHKITQQFAVCTSCKNTVVPRTVWLGAEYKDLAKDLVHTLKFERAKAAAGLMAGYLDSLLPFLDDNTVITNVPTANSRVRIRGYDQSKLIAKSFAARRGLKYCECLQRIGSLRQVGSSRKDRLTQLETAFQPLSVATFKKKPVLLIDDVLTTGATIEAAAKVLKANGAKSVEAAVFAH
jgi:ComF family protein